MIELFKKRKYQYNDIAEILSDINKEELYFTENNQRFFINNVLDFKKLLKHSHHCYYLIDESTNSKGLVLIWKSQHGTVVRRFVKLIANNSSTAKKLLNLLLWAYPQELYIKVRKNSEYAYIFKGRGFKFEGDRGTEILLKKMKSLPIIEASRNSVKEEE